MKTSNKVLLIGALATSGWLYFELYAVNTVANHRQRIIQSKLEHVDLQGFWTNGMRQTLVDQINGDYQSLGAIATYNHDGSIEIAWEDERA